MLKALISRFFTKGKTPTALSSGGKAEKISAKSLQKIGYEIIATNWKTPACEIDIIARKDGIVFFVEVKYRKNPDQGTGFDYITPSKIVMMKRGAELFLSKHTQYSDLEVSLAALEVYGTDFEVSELIELNL